MTNESLDRHSHNSEQLEKWYRSASPRDRQEFDQVYDSLDRYRSSIKDDIDSLSYLPPKPSESYSRLRFNNKKSIKGIATTSSSMSPRYTSPVRYSNDRLNSSSGSLNPPRSPPSKVGSVMWGNETPLSRKGARN